MGFAGLFGGDLESGLGLYSIIFLNYDFFQIFLENYFNTEIYFGLVFRMNSILGYGNTWKNS